MAQYLSVLAEAIDSSSAKANCNGSIPKKQAHRFTYNPRTAAPASERHMREDNVERFLRSADSTPEARIFSTPATSQETGHVEEAKKALAAFTERFS